MILSVVINGETLNLGDEISVTGNKKEKFYVTELTLDKLDRVKDIYAIDKNLKKIIQVNKEGFVCTGNTCKKIQTLKKALEKC